MLLKELGHSWGMVVEFGRIVLFFPRYRNTVQGDKGTQQIEHKTYA